MNLQVIQRPFILPFQDNLVTLPFHGQPQVTAVNGVLGRQMSAMKMNFPGLPCTGRMKVLWPPNVMPALGPTQGFFNSIHGPAMFLATALRAALGAQPVHPEAIR